MSTTMTEVWFQHRPNIAGTWVLQTYEIHDTTQNPRQLISKPHGETPQGRVVITPGRFMSAQVMAPDAMTPLPSDAGDQEVAARLGRMSFYCGTFEVFQDSERGELVFVTTVAIASDVGRLGGKQFRRLRYWEEEEQGEGKGKGKYMMLTPVRDLEGSCDPTRTSFLKWKKVESL